MFVKMFKYDFKATWGLLGLLSVIALGVGVLGSGVARMLGHAPDGLPMTLLILAMMAVVFYLVGYCIASMFLLLGRFYKSRFTDEGYMTFTLPVSTHQVLLSSFLNCALGMLLCMIVTAVSFGILVFFGAESLDSHRWEFVKLCFEHLPELWDLLDKVGVGNILMFLLMLLAGFLSQIMTIMLAITLGSIIAKKHKILTGVVAYYGINTLITIAGVSILSSRLFDQVMSEAEFIGFSAWAVAGYAVVALGCYFVMYWLTSRKLNLN